MNSTLEKLVDYALVDGYISEKEKEVLFKKATEAGFDTDELQIILNGRLHHINQSVMPKVNKCPNCGEVITGLSKVCPSCDYITDIKASENGNSLQDQIYRLEDCVYSLKSVPKTGIGSIFNSAFFIVITFGLYIIYKK